MFADMMRLELGEVHAIPLHVSHDWDLLFLLKGSAKLEMQGSVYAMQGEDIVLCTAGQAYALHSQQANILLRLQIDSEMLRKEFALRGDFFCNTLLDPEKFTAKYFELKRLVTRLMLTYFQHEDGYHLKLDTALLQLLNFLAANFPAGEASPALPPNETALDDNIWPALDYINKNYRHHITLQKLAEREHLSVHYLSRLFKQKTGQGFLSYLNGVRLRYALHDLLHSEDTILKIALNSGFSSSDSFSKAFQRQYGENPSAFRHKHTVSHHPASADFHIAEVHSGQELITYLSRFELKYRDSAEKSATLHLDMQKSAQAQAPSWQRIIRIGRACEGLKQEIVLQLHHLRQQIRIDYLHFKILFADGMYHYPPDSTYTFYEYDRIFDFLRQIGVRPLLQINISDALCSLEPGQSFQELIEGRVGEFLQHCRQHYGAETDAWMFEITHNGSAEKELLHHSYCLLYQTIKRHFGGSHVGCCFSDAKGLPPQQDFPQLLALAAQQAAYPDFISVYANPEQIADISGEADYRQSHGYYSALLRQISGIAQAAGKIPPLYLLDWNTLRGSLAMKLDPFFRSALIIDTLTDIASQIAGAAFWVNSYCYEAVYNKANANILAMFISRLIKRPVFFVVLMLDMLNGRLLYRGDNIILTQTEDGAYVLLIYNPCYFNPMYASDESFLQTQKRMLTLLLQNLQGRFVFERFILDHERGAMYHRWSAMGFPSLLEENITEYLEANVNMDYSMFEESISGVFPLQIELKFNAAMLYRIRPAK